jgi:hypothetical protein
MQLYHQYGMDYYYHLDANSPCINAGDPNGDYSGQVDIDGEDRVYNGIVDMGADEFYTYGVIYVDTDANGDDDGTSWTDAFNYLQDGLDAVSGGDEIWVAEGTYYPDDGNSVTENNRSETFQLIEDVNIYGGFDPTTGDDLWSERDWAGNVTILDGDINVSVSQFDNSYHVVTSTVNATIDGFTIQSGNADGTGVDKSGAGMRIYYYSWPMPSVIVRNCTFDDHLADVTGAGILKGGNTSITVENCIFISGDIPQGSSDYGGGAILTGAGNAIIENCAFFSNRAPFGGAIYNRSTDGLVVNNCLFYDNSTYNAAYNRGGAICVLGGDTDVNVTNCTFVDNYSYDGGGFAIKDSSGTANITNCIFWGNTSDPSHSPQIDNDSSTVVVAYSDIEGGYAGTGNINSDPCFVDSTDPDGDDNIWITSDDGLRLDSDANSPCIDAADSNDTPTTDILGNNRYDDPNTTDTGAGDPNYYDMGAYEYQ